MRNTSLPIACSLTSAEFQERRISLLEKVKRGILEVREVAEGYAFRFPPDDDWLIELTNLIRLERQCCPFLDFQLKVESGNGPIWLELTGPQGTKEFVATLLQ